MMAIVVPGADYRQLRGKSTTPLSPQVIDVHTMAGGLAGTEAHFSGLGRPYSHLGTGGGGDLRQWQDLQFRAASDLEGNWRCISIENEDTGAHFPNWSGSDVPRFTDAQAATLVVVLSWLCHRFGLPRSAIRSSCIDQRGIGYHRLGIDHSTGDPNAPGAPWRTPGCPHWSSSSGKVCPGDRRIAQLRNEIIPAVSTPSPPPAPKDWFDMATEAQLRKILREEVPELVKATINEGLEQDTNPMALRVNRVATNAAEKALNQTLGPDASSDARKGIRASAQMGVGDAFENPESRVRKGLADALAAVPDES